MSKQKRRTPEERLAILQEVASGSTDALKIATISSIQLKRLQRNAQLKELVAEKELHIKIQNEL